MDKNTIITLTGKKEARGRKQTGGEEGDAGTATSDLSLM